MKNILILLAATFLFACSSPEKPVADIENPEEISASQEIPVISIADFDEKAGEFVNNEVMISGIVDHVCKHGGKKLLLVNDDGDVHITSDERFDDALIGEEIKLIGIVEEFRVDEGYCIQMEDDNIKSHSEGESDDELFEKKKHSIQAYRDSMEASGVDHLSYYSLVFVSFENEEEAALEEAKN